MSGAVWPSVPIGDDVRTFCTTVPTQHLVMSGGQAVVDDQGRAVTVELPYDWCAEVTVWRRPTTVAASRLSARFGPQPVIPRGGSLLGSKFGGV